MKTYNILKLGLSGILGLIGCNNTNDTTHTLSQPPQKDSVSIVQYTPLPQENPQLSDLEKRVINFTNTPENKEALLQQAKYGEDFNTAVKLFIGNYTLGVSSDLGYNLEHNQPTSTSTIYALKTKAREIRNNGQTNDEWTLRRCAAAEELDNILQNANTQGHLKEATQVIGYLERGSSRMGNTFSSFAFFYDHDRDNDGPQTILQWYAKDIAQTKEMQKQAKTAFNSLSETVKKDLVMWIGHYGYDALEGTITQTWTCDYNTNTCPTTTTKLLPNLPTAPQKEPETFYQHFGEDLLKVYGLI